MLSVIVKPSCPDGWLARGAKGSNLKYVLHLVLLGSDVEIVVKPRTRAAGRARVVVA